MKYILGTAQFGLDYGISNKKGKLKISDIERILIKAKEKKVDYLDTASSYGEAETTIGNLYDLTCDFKIITKTAHFKKEYSHLQNIDRVTNEFNHSLDKMKRPFADVLLIHNTENILGETGYDLFAALEKIKDSGKALKIGVSVYTTNELFELCRNFPIDFVQYPLNVYNQSFLESSLLYDLKLKGIELHARSIFLQGLLLIPPKKLSSYFESIRKHHEKYYEFLDKNNLSSIEGALNFLTYADNLDGIVFGVESCNQLSDVIDTLKNVSYDLDYRKFKVDDEKITNPSNWRI